MGQGKIVLMACGSFSPPTYMHLRMFEIAKDYIHSIGLGTVIGGIISPVHDAYGKKDLVAANHRISMLKLALQTSSWIKVSEWETQQTGWTRTRVSMQYHQDTINNQISQSSIDPPLWIPDDILNNSLDEPDNLQVNGDPADGGVTVKLLCGADLLESFATPGLWADEDIATIVGRHGLVVVSRAGSDPGKFIYESDVLHKYRQNIFLVTNYIANEVSSTVIRRLMRRGESAKYLTDDHVLAYIRQNMLYGASSGLAEYITDYIQNYDEKSPQDVTMTSPDECYKSIVISIRDKPSIVDETITVKRPRKNFIMSNTFTDSVSPMSNITPKLAYTDTSGTIKPKIAYTDTSGTIKSKIACTDTSGTIKPKIAYTDTSGTIKSKIAYADTVPGKAVKVTCEKHVKVSEDMTCLEVLCNDKRRASEGNLIVSMVTEAKKRCSSTIRKLRPEDQKRTKIEVSSICDRLGCIKVKDGGKCYRTRSCNDLLKKMLDKQGIQVISDTEALV